jgi:hypothetical protein
MRAVSIFAASLSAGAAIGALGCGNGDDNFVPPPVVKIDAGADASKPEDATAGGDASGSAMDVSAQDVPSANWEAGPTPTLALLRLANWSADSPAIDFCTAPHGTGSFTGPILGAKAGPLGEAGVIDSGSGALSFPNVSVYLVVDPGQYDVRLVAGGSVDCSVGILPDATNLPALASGGLATLALFGAAQPQHGEPGLELVGFTDELHGATPGALVVRVINAAVDFPSVAVGTLTMFFTPFGEQAVAGQSEHQVMPVPYGTSSVGDPFSDPNGYLQQIPVPSQVVAARSAVPSLFDAATHTIIAQAPGISLGAGAAVTFVVVGVGSSGGASSGLAQILECVDNAASLGLSGSCQVISR